MSTPGTTPTTESLPRTAEAFFAIGDLVELHWPDGSDEVVKISPIFAVLGDTHVTVERLEFDPSFFVDDLDRYPMVRRSWLRPVRNA